MCFPIISTIYY